MGCRCGAVTPLEARPDLEAVAAAARGAGPTRNAVSAAHDLARIPSGLEKLAFPAFGELSAIRFTPARDLAGDDFDYESSVQVDGSVMQISYAPMAYMHGGYERALRNAF